MDLGLLLETTYPTPTVQVTLLYCLRAGYFSWRKGKKFFWAGLICLLVRLKFFSECLEIFFSQV